MKKAIVLSILTVILVVLACGRQRLPAGNGITMDHFDPYTVTQAELERVRKEQGPDSDTFLVTLMSREMRVAKIHPITPDTLALIRREVDKRNDSLFNAAYDLLEAVNNFDRNYYLSYEKAHHARLVFERLHDTSGLIYAYHAMAFRHRSTIDEVDPVNEKRIAANKQKMIELMKRSKRPDHQATYWYYEMSVSPGTPEFEKRDYAYFEKIYGNMMVYKDRIRNRPLIYNAQNTLAVVYYYKGQIAKSDSMIRLKAVTAPIGYRHVAVADLSYLSTNINRPDSILKYRRKALETYTKDHIDERYFLIETFGALSAAYSAKRDFEKALLYTRKRDSVERETDKINSQIAIRSLDAKYNIDKKNFEIRQKEKQRRWFAILSFIGILLAIVAAALGYYNYKSRRRLEELYEREGDIKRVISHDVLSPLTSLDMLNQRLASSLEKGSKELEMTRRQQAYIQNISALCHNLVGWLWHTKPQGPESNTIKALLDDLLFELEGFVASYDATVRLEIAGDASTVEVPDPNALRTVLRNLLTNSLRHGKSKDVVIKCNRNGGKLRVVLQDDGLEIDADLGATLTRLLNGKTDGRSMSGLGLYLAGKFLASLKGRYWIEPATEVGFNNQHVVEIPV